MNTPSPALPPNLLITDELQRRAAKPPRFEDESRALVALAACLAETPRSVLQALAGFALELTGAHSAGITLAEGDILRWHATAGEHGPRLWETLPRDFSPCGEVLRNREPMLMAHPHRHYPYIDPAITELLLLPFFQGPDAIGTVWVLSMTPEKRFDAEDARLVADLARFASAALQTLAHLDSLQASNERLQREMAEREQTAASLRDSEARHRFLAELAERTQTLTDPGRMMDVTARHLGEHLAVDRCVYVEVEEDQTHFCMTSHYTRGLEEIAGRFSLGDYGAAVHAAVRAGQVLAVDDVETDPRTAPVAAAYRQLGIRALICAPIVKDGRLTAAMVVQQAAPRRWSAGAVELVALVASRSWESIERSRAQRSLRAKDERLQMLLGHSIDFAVIFFDTELRIVEWTGGAEHITGWTSAEAIGRSAHLLYTDEDVAGGVPEREFGTAKESGRADDKRWHRRKDGSLFFADGICVSLHGPDGELRGYGKVMRDVTGRKRAEDRLAALLEAERKRSALMRQVAATSRSVNISLSIESIVRLVTEDARHLIGAHQSALSLTPDEDGSQAINAVSLSDKYAVWRSRPGQADVQGLRAQVCRGNQPLRLTQHELERHPEWKDIGNEPGRPPLRGWLAVPLLSHGGANLGLLQLSDKYEGDFTEEDEAILTQLAAVAAVGIQNAQLYEMLREQDRRKDEFLATLAHELRNPLAPLRTGLEVLKLAQNEEVRRQSREMMERQLGHMIHLIDDLLDLSRVSQGKVELRRSRVDVGRLVEAAIETSLPAIRAARHELALNLPDEPLLLDADPTRITQVVSNLLNNAAKFTPKGGRIEIGVQREGERAVIRVSDNGIGIPPAMLTRIFGIFAQVGRQNTQTQGGLGIGLSLVKRLVEMHGGSVRAESEGLGLGSRFIIELPLAPGAPAAAGAADGKDGRPAAEAGNLSVLVVDDNVDAAESLALLAQMYGHDCRIAYSGPGALETLEAWQPDIIFLDIGLPGMSGYDVARRVRERASPRPPLLVAVTGWGSETDKRRSREVGFDHHLTKPVDVDQVGALLASASERVRSTHPPAG